MLKLLNFLGFLRVSKLPYVKGVIYAYFSRKVNNIYNKGCSIKISDTIDLTYSIVSLTTYGERTNKVHITLDSIFSQTIRPYKVMLWLSKEEYSKETIPFELKKRLVDYPFFEIGFCDDLKPHKKYYEAMLQNPNNNIITADDDVFYPSNWLETLLKHHRLYPKFIICNNAHKMTIHHGTIGEYGSWKFLTQEIGPSLLLCPIGVGGVLYPPGSLNQDVFKKEVIVGACLNADDLWLKIMGLLNGTKVVNTCKYSYTFLSINGAKSTALSISNVIDGGNDIQLRNILNIYKNQLSKILYE